MADIELLPADTRYFTEVSAPSTPSSGQGVLYAATDGTLHYLNDAATDLEIGSGGGGGDVATDSIWDAAGDLAVGSGADTAARLAIGAAGTLPTVIGGALVYALRSPTNNIVATSQGHSGVSTWVNLATTGPAVTATVPASGVVKVTVCGHANNTTSGGYGGMGFALSGANTVAAANTKCLQFGTSAQTFDMRAAATFLLTGLSAGSTTFTAKYNQFGGPGTTNWSDREIIVEPVP